MRYLVAIVIAAALQSPLMVYSLLRSKARAETEKAWQYIVRAVLPILAFVLMAISNIATETLFSSLQHVPSQYTQIPELIANLLGVGVLLLLSIDNIRCRSGINRILGALFVIAGVFLGLLVVAQS